jgi:hypothetical protein
VDLIHKLAVHAQITVKQAVACTLARWEHQNVPGIVALDEEVANSMRLGRIFARRDLQVD